MQYFSIDEIKGWERFYRANFINSLQGFKPVSLLGTVSENGIPNLAIFSNIVHIGADPALIGFINRPIEAAPHTIQNIKLSGEFTINHIQPSFVAAAHQTSAKYSTDQNEFLETGLKTFFLENFKAPFVFESEIKYGLDLVEIVPITHNNTFLVIGSVKHVLLKEGLIQQDGFIDANKAQSITSLGLDGYYSTEPIARFEYAKPGKELKKIT
ncbi:MAG: flavin oxidoreductase [Chitinophagia bacterium]|nr:flavin oxidoreductase [Chitinophagia bacterium]